MNTFLVAASSAFLFLAPHAGSAGTRTAALLLAAIALALGWRRAPVPWRDRFPRAITATFVAWALLAAVSVVWSVDRAYTVDELRSEALYPAIVLVVFFLAAQAGQRWRAWVIAMLAGTVTVFLLHMLQKGFGVTFTRHSVFEQRGPWSTHLVLMAPLVLALGWRRPWGMGAPAWAAAAALGLLLCAAWETDNRIIWVALALQFLIAAALRGSSASDNGGALVLRRVTVTAALVATIALAMSIADRSALHFAGAGASADSLERDVRPRIWGVAWGKFREAPWFGHGFGREVLAAEFIPHTPSTLNHPQIRHGHNVFVDMALELGVAGVGLLALLLALVANEYRGYLARAELAPLGVLGLLVLSGFIVKCLTDDFLYRHNGLVFWALNAMLIGLARASGAPAGPTPRGVAAPQ